MFDGYDSCSEESTSSSSSDDSEDEVPPIPPSLPIIKNNGQVYTYPDGKAGMGQYTRIRISACYITVMCSFTRHYILGGTLDL